ncbi:MAG TPA: hypothetical protein VHV27_12535 [Phenylobacterium sp.]|jgi:hypothetical protein|nr:hypothetical protein [Phenylobacterium sp.]
MLYALPLVYSLLAFCLLTCAFALWKGGLAERLAAAAIVTSLVAGCLSWTLFESQVVDLAIDGVSALVLLVIALRFASPWLGAVMLVYAMQFGLDAYYLVLERPSANDKLHVAINNADTFAISLCLAAGTVAAWRRRARSRPLDTALQAAP